MVVVYVIVVLWLVSANFRSSLSSLAQSGKRNIFGQMVGPLPHLRDDGELESLIVVRDKGQKKNKAKCTTELDHEDDGDYVWETKYLHHYYFTTYQNPDFLSNVNQAKKYTLEATSGIKFTVSQRIVKPDWLVVVSLPTNHYHTNFFVVSREEEEALLLYATAWQEHKKVGT